MIQAINGVMLALGSSFVGSTIAKATLIVVLALIVIHIARSARAAVRHTMLAAAFAVLLALPVASILTPPMHVTLRIAPQASAYIPPVSNGVEKPSLSTTAVATPLAVAPRRSLLSLSAILLTLWSIGAALFLAPVILGLWQIRSLRRTGLAWQHGQDTMARLAREIGVSRHVELLLHESAAGPMTCGILRPTIVLSPDAQFWNEDDLDRAISHELEHIRRADWLTHCLARIVCAVYWFHPLVWIAKNKLTLEAERACDDAVIARSQSEATAYADQLVSLARRLLSAPPKSPLLAMASRSDLAARVSAVLDSRQRRGRAGAFTIALACITAALVTVTIASVALVAGAQDPGADWEKAAGGNMKFEVASVKEDNAAITPETVHFNMPITTWDFPVGTPTGGLFAATNLPVDVYLGFAYKLQGYANDAFERQLPNWAAFGGKRYDIEARAAGNPTRDQYRLMIQSLLIDRFKLAVHWETKQMPVMALVLNKPGRLGPHLRAHLDTPPCPNSQEVVLPQIVPATAEGFPLECGVIATDRKNGAPGNRRYFARNVSIASLAITLSTASRDTEKLVVDKTGLTGNYDFVFEYTPDNLNQPGSDGIKLIDALKDDLGLKLEPTTAPVKVPILDHIEEPSKN